MNMNFTYPALTVLAAAALALSGCAPSAPASAPSATDAAASPAAAADGLAVSQPWVKAAASGMTGAFGVIKNTTGADITVTGASTPAARMAELHETVAGTSGGMQMRAKEGGFVIPAGGELKLEPGANHVMLMGLTGPVKAGDEITLTLELAGGGTFSFTALAKDFRGANENYVEGGAGMTGHQPSSGSTASPSPSANK
ncbi:copper chaperone PCu(A)C [Arthrobacter sp. Soil763]|uniref:copper chaperone PCu(A)C n=1 Tax=Arthrobacter sp. Soil763 TaxID=1736402 RepID=UPI0009E90E52|nr:copper chaperone PCu(A)C [Arthrobacter sp. Soil763]